MTKMNDIVEIKKEWQDSGDDAYTWAALEDEDGGRVLISPINTGLDIPPSQVVRTSMLVIQ